MDDKGELNAATVIIGFAITIIILIGMIGYINNQMQVTPGVRNDQVDNYSFLIFKDADNNTLAKEGNAHTIQFKDSSASIVIQDCLDAVKDIGGGSIYLKYGTYNITTPLNVSRFTKLTGDFGTILTSDTLPIIDIQGGYKYDLALNETACGFEISNFKIIYTGPVTAGAVVHLRMIQTDREYIPYALLKNLMIQSTQTETPTDTDFIGLGIEDTIGLDVQDMQIFRFGVGLDFLQNVPPAGTLDSEHNNYNHVTITFCRIGVREHSLGGQNCHEYWNRLKIMDCSKTGAIIHNYCCQFFDIDIDEMTGYGDGSYQCGMNISSSYCMIVGGQFQTIKDVCIEMHNCHMTIQNIAFSSSVYAMYAIQSYVDLTSNTYASITNMLYTDVWQGVHSINDACRTENSGIATVTGSDTWVVVTHHIYPYPMVILLTPLLNGTDDIGAYWIEDRNASTFQINFENAPGSNTWYFYWYASSTQLPS
jgi:hypothetical protein